MVVDRFVIVDIETTGLKAGRDDIIQISAIRICNGEPETKAFSQWVRPRAGYIPPEIETLTGIPSKLVAKAPLIQEVMPKFKEFIGDDLVCGWNVGFDWLFLTKESPDLHNEVKDLLPLVKEKVPDLPSYKLTNVARHFNLDTQNAHCAIFDCILTYQVLKASGLLP